MPTDAASWTSLLPPLAAIVLAVWTRHVIVSLFAGLWLGATMLAGWNPLAGLYRLIVEFAYPQATEPWNVSVLLLMLCIGGFVELVVRSGTAEAFAVALSRLVTNRRRAQGAVWSTGIVVFFSDSANPLILGPLYAPLFDRLKLSREKLAYLIDSTASPICILVPITSWAAFILSLLSRQLENLGVAVTPMSVYLESIPLQFYAIASLLLVPAIGLGGFDYGPMRRAEFAAATRATPVEASPVSEESADTANDGGAIRGALALGTVAIVIVTALLISGGFPESGALDAITAGNSVLAVMLGFIAGTLVLAALLLARARLRVVEAARHWTRGAFGMRGVLAILILAWSLGVCCDALGTGNFVAGVVERSVIPLYVPALVFLAAAVISFATGSAWGCYAIMMPIALPIAIQAGLPLHVVVAALLSGGILGDHASPISDTTILSSIGAGCDHVAHVKTQLPYAATAALAALAGFLLLGAWSSPWTLLPVLVLMIGLALLFGSLASLRT